MNSLMRNASLAVCCTLVSALLSGCGDSGAKEQADTPTESTQSSSTSSETQLVAAVDSAPNVDGIPLDIYGTDFTAALPGTDAGGGRATGGGPVDGGDGDGNGGTDPEPQPEPETGGAIVWSELITAEQIEGEIKKVRNDFATKMTSMGSYNSSYLEIPVFGSTVALLAHIATEHDGDIGWKEKAPLIRVLANQMVAVTSSNQARGRGGYTKTNEAFLKICDLLDGNDPPELPEVTEVGDFSEVAEMGYLMKRVEKGVGWMQTNVGSEDNFKENTDAAQREAAIFSVMAVVFNLEDYGYGPASNDEEFAGYADAMRDASKAANGAAQGGNFEDFDLQRSKIGQACSQCHMVYRNG